ncbi:unnamed protein product (macronuclear) [Paramecium tetraurelia]|uniref:Uncharacterized protein n=1 Tax=Paramecium tetraurelia TaxID=5888 RepID=A0CSE6_PARTE|nr:uncharacterized protein GSPATT00009985001 [Paramecium tetraurelia]CAK73713.1 unnamed protein product [Paramecium tetraurelia]|eukprot:XP_001441110.1 hypothetical protein (macronuclear) [Paramecium tetraurelia strain d4-2]
MAEQGRYSKLSEEEAAAQFELRKQQILGNLQEQYQNANSQKNKKQSKSQQHQSNQQEFIVFNPNKKQSSQPSKKSSIKLQIHKEESPLLNQGPPQEQEIEYEIQQPVDPIPPEQSPLIDKSQKPGVKKMLLRDIGNLDLEIQRLTRETKDFKNEKSLNKSQLSQQSRNLKESLTKSNSRPSSLQQQQSKPYYELRQRPSSKESRISDASYTKKAECFKGVIRSSSLKKLPQSSKTHYNFLQLRSASEKKINQSINKTNTIESENKETSNKIVQSERKIPKPIIQINRSQSKQDTPTYEKKTGTPVKSILKVQFNSIPLECNSTKNNSASYFHQHKESYNSQISFSKNKCVEAQIEEAVQLYNNLKSLIQNKTSVLQVRKDGNLIPRKTADFFYHKEMQKPTLY